MTSPGATILFIVERRPGLSDDDLAEAIYGRHEQQLVNAESLHLANHGEIERRQNGARIGHFPVTRNRISEASKATTAERFRTVSALQSKPWFGPRHAMPRGRDLDGECPATGIGPSSVPYRCS